MVHSVLIVGLGNVGMGYDLADASGHKALSHARAFAGHPGFRLAAGVDASPERRRLFVERYVAPAHADLVVALQESAPDVVVVATPTASHRAVIETVLEQARPSAILCEKPLAYTLVDAQAITEACAAASCALFVNYFRNSEPGVVELQRRCRNGRIAGPLKGVVWYSRGMYNSASHFACMLQSMLPPATGWRLLAPGRRWQGNDPEPDFEIAYGDSRVLFLANKEENFFHNGIELLAANGRLCYEQGGAQIVWQGTAADPRFAGYIRLDAAGETIASDFDRIQGHVTEQLARALDGAPADICTGTAALATQEILSQIEAMS